MSSHSPIILSAYLEFPFSNDLVNGLGFLLGGVSNSVGTVDFQLQILHFGGQSLFGLLQGDDLLVQRLDGFLSLGKTSLQLASEEGNKSDVVYEF